MPASDLALLTRQLSALLGAGVQLVDALTALSDQSTRAATKRMLSQVRERVREGSSLADTLTPHRDTFSDLYIGMVRAGEQAAALEAVLDRLAEYSERQSEFVTKVRGAMTYPIIMMCVGTAIMGVLVVYVVPQVATISSNSAALPIATRILIGFSALITGYWIPLLLLLVGLVAGISAAMATPRGRRVYDTALLKMWYIGRTMIRIISRASRGRWAACSPAASSCSRRSMRSKAS